MKKILTLTTFVVIATVIMTSCGSSKKASKGYDANQKAPVTEEQKKSVNRGVKLQKEECEEMALEETKDYRESGNAISEKEALATNLALLDARAKMAQQLEVLVTGMIRNFDQQHTEGNADKAATIGKGTNLQQAYFEQFLTNTRPICKNTYVREDGKFNVYVCIKLGEQEKKAILNKLKEDKIIEIDVREDMAIEEMNKLKEARRQKLLEE